MNPIDLISEFYEPGSRLFDLIVRHGEHVANKAVLAAGKVPHLKPNLDFIQEAAMIHDIGIFLTDSPELDCSGKYPYICHGYLGRELLVNNGFPIHALVCERHVGVGIRAEEIRRHRLPLPMRNMFPVSIEEQVICFADKFFSKNGPSKEKEKPVKEILRTLKKYGDDKVMVFQSWIELFG